jgi:hypothetical protein
MCSDYIGCFYHPWKNNHTLTAGKTGLRFLLRRLLAELDVKQVVEKATSEA